MIAMKIFWSWQSDTPQDEGRHFVRDVIAALADELNYNVEAEDAERQDGDGQGGEPTAESRVEVDHDTRGVGGSPPIADTILKKIRKAAVLVADVTPIATTTGGKRVPNPNVMIELGYAMEVLGHERIVLVMNTVDGAGIKHLPFDLRHWRAPVTYKLHKGATDNQRDAAAQQLRSDLKARVKPGLAKAMEIWSKETRLTDRAPELSVVLDRDGSGPFEISQMVSDLGCRSLDEIREETPELPLPHEDGSCKRDTFSLSRSGGILAGFGKPPPPSQWSRAETEGYNRQVRSYYRRYEEFLKRRTEFLALVKRSFEVRLTVANTGTAPATGIDVRVTFPEGLVLYDDRDGEREFPSKPEPPKPPELRPVIEGQAVLVHPSPMGLDFRTHAWLPRSTLVDPGERRVEFSTERLKHNDSEAVEPFLVSFATAEDIRSFEAKFVIRANEPIDPITGVVPFEVVSEDG